MSQPFMWRWYDLRPSSINAKFEVMGFSSVPLSMIGLVAVMMIGPELVLRLPLESIESEVFAAVVSSTSLLGIWFLLLAAWALVMFEVARWWHVRAGERSVRLTRCWNCGYSLAGLAGPLCPECGGSGVIVLRG